jgi:hypothetical protein
MIDKIIQIHDYISISYFFIRFTQVIKWLKPYFKRVKCKIYNADSDYTYQHNIRIICTSNFPFERVEFNNFKVKRDI